MLSVASESEQNSLRTRLCRASCFGVDFQPRGEARAPRFPRRPNQCTYCLPLRRTLRSEFCSDLLATESIRTAMSSSTESTAIKISNVPRNFSLWLYLPYSSQFCRRRRPLCSSEKFRGTFRPRSRFYLAELLSAVILHPEGSGSDQNSLREHLCRARCLGVDFSHRPRAPETPSPFPPNPPPDRSHCTDAHATSFDRIHSQLDSKEPQ